jgi:uncharacterized protein
MRRPLWIVLVILLSGGIFLALGLTFPVYANFLPNLLFLFVIDGYLWLSIRHKILEFRPVLKYALGTLYWLPPLLIVCCIVAGIFVPFTRWNIPLRTLVPGTILVIYVAKIFPVVFLLLADLTRLFRYGLDNYFHGPGVRFSDRHRNRWIIGTGWVSGTLFLLLLLLGMVWWNYDFNVKKQEIVLPELPSEFEGLRIVQISDLHLGSWVCRSELEKAVTTVNSLSPDVIFFTGDMANYTVMDVLPFEGILGRMKAPDGIFAILGNHDYGAYVKWPSEEAKRQDMLDLQAFYHRLGWRLLLNDHSILRRGNDSIAVLGVQNWGKAHRFQKLANVAAAQKGVENMKVKLLLSHDPTFWDSILCHQYPDIDITFSGHTHGLQFGIECCGIRWSPAEYLYKQWAGLYEKPVPGSHPQYIYVNRGLGSLGYPGRVGILPEITVITLRK